MSLDSKLKHTKQLVDREMLKLIPKKPSRGQFERIIGKTEYAFDYNAATEAVHKPVWDLLDRGGKRWRPALFLMIAEAFGADAKKLLPYSIIPEITHNGTLMVDDVEDNSDMRRGKPAINRIYGADVAINAGNAMYFLPMLALKRKNSGISEKTAVAAYEIYMQEMINLSYGQGLDIYWHHGRREDVSEKEYLQMCAFKTGTLARMAAKLGALFGSASETQINLAGDFAASIGVAFQIQDDILNLTASEEYGKEIGGDVSEGKRTLITIRAVEKLPPEKRHRLLEILNSHTKDQLKIGEAISLIKSTDALEYSKARASALVRNAWVKFAAVLKGGRAKDELKEFADYLITRKV